MSMELRAQDTAGDSWVTIRDTMIPVVEVLVTVRDFGMAGAHAQWPELTEPEVRVCSRLVHDLEGSRK
jgi:hypothetical protein